VSSLQSEAEASRCRRTDKPSGFSRLRRRDRHPPFRAASVYLALPALGSRPSLADLGSTRLSGRVPKNDPDSRPATLPASGVVVIVWLPLTGSLSGSQPRAFSPGPPHRGGRAFGRRTSRDVTRPSRAAVRGASLAKGTRASTARNACHRLDLAVLPRGRSLRRSGARAWCPDSLSEPSRRTSWIDRVPAVGRARLGAASPALKARRARSPIPGGTPSLRWGPGTRGARPGGGPRSNRPMSAAHGFCFQDRTPSRLGALRTISPRRGSHRFTPMSSLGRVCRADQSVFCPGTVPQTYLLTPRRFAGCPAERKCSEEHMLRRAQCSEEHTASASVARGTLLGAPRVLPESLGRLERAP